MNNQIAINVSGAHGLVPYTYKTVVLKPNVVDGKNILTQLMMGQTNTKYVIKYDYVIDPDIQTGIASVSESNISHCVNPNYAAALAAYNLAHDAWIDADNAYTNNPNDTTLAAKNAAYATYTAAQTTLNNTPQFYYYAANAILVKQGQYISIPKGCVLLNASLSGITDFVVAPADTTVYIGSLTAGEYNYTVQNAIVIPSGCLIEFDGGSISDGVLVGDETILVFDQEEEVVLKNVELLGDFEYSAGGSGGGIPDKEYDPENHSGLGRKTLQLKGDSNILTQEDFDQENTIYVISYDFDLGNAEINIPEGCVLDFEGGSLRNGLITSTGTFVRNYTIDCISNLYVVNGFIPMESNIHNTGNTIYTLECFGDYRTDALTVFNLAIHNSLNRIVYVNEDIKINQNGTALNVVSNYTTLASQNNSKITFTSHITFYASSYLTIKDIHLHFDTPSQMDQLFVSGSNHIIIENIEMSGTYNENEEQRYGGGIHVIQCLNTIIRKNRIHDVFLNGILVHNDCIYIDIIDNFVDGSTNIGIEIEGRSGGLGTTEAHPCSNITIIGNQLYNCADCGININFSNTVNIVGNIVKYTRIGLNCISCQNVAISSNYVISNGSALLIDQEFFGDIDLTNQNISVSNNTFSGGISNNLTGKGKVINALVPIQNAGNIKIINNTFAIHKLVDTRTKDNDCVIAVLSSRYVKILNNQIIGYANELPTKYNTGILIGRSYKVQQTTNYYEVTDELQEIPSDIKIANNTIGYLAYGISTIIPNSTDTTPYTDGVENKVNQLQVCGNTIKECVYDVNIGRYAVDWKIEDSVLINNTTNNYPSSGTTPETPQIMKGAVKGTKYWDETLGKPVYWSGTNWVDATGTPV